MAVHPVAPRWRIEARSGEARSGGVTIRMIGFEGRLQWRQHKLFKLRAKLPQRKKWFIQKWLRAMSQASPSLDSQSKICDSLISCAPHKK
jgi:hypothetical protein